MYGYAGVLKPAGPSRNFMAAAATVRQVITTAPLSVNEYGSGAATWTWTGFSTPGKRGNFLDADAQLVDRCLGGDETAWEDLVKVHTRRVFSICYRFTGSDSEAQDLTQEVFLRIFRSLKTFRQGEGSFTV